MWSNQKPKVSEENCGLGTLTLVDATPLVYAPGLNVEMISVS